MKSGNYFLLLVIFLFLYSCTDTVNVELSDYFPNADGNWWEYQYSDSLTMRLELSGVETIDNTEVQKLIWNYEGDTDTDYVLRNESEIILYTTPQSWSAFTLAKLPLEEGNSWQAFRIIVLGDTTTITAHVEEKLSISVPAGEFSDCYRIYYENQTLEQPIKIYFAPDVGPVKFEYATGGEEVLIDYDVEL
jgi:hypothetical protein